MEQSTNTRPSGHSISVTAYGDNVNEIELDAIDKARAFFGDDVRLQVRRDYQVQVVTRHATDETKASGKSHLAKIAVDVVE